MKKLSKLSLLGEIDILTKSELTQLVGSGDNNECKSAGEYCESGGIPSVCAWVVNSNGYGLRCVPGGYGGYKYEYYY